MLHSCKIQVHLRQNIFLFLICNMKYSFGYNVISRSTMFDIQSWVKSPRWAIIKLSRVEHFLPFRWVMTDSQHVPSSTEPNSVLFRCRGAREALIDACWGTKSKLYSLQVQPTKLKTCKALCVNGECAQRNLMEAVNTSPLPAWYYSRGLSMLTAFAPTHAHKNATTLVQTYLIFRSF